MMASREHSDPITMRLRLHVSSEIAEICNPGRNRDFVCVTAVTAECQEAAAW